MTTPKEPVHIFESRALKTAAHIVAGLADRDLADAAIAYTLHDLSQAVFERGNAPDIQLPDVDAYITPGYAKQVPMTQTADLDGVRYQFVNWFDFRGWEVRAADSFQSMDKEPKRLGFLSQVDGQKWRAKRPPLSFPERQTFVRVDEAVRFLRDLPK